jgi:hypothetical protein
MPTWGWRGRRAELRTPFSAASSQWKVGRGHSLALPRLCPQCWGPQLVFPPGPGKADVLHEMGLTGGGLCPVQG